MSHCYIMMRNEFTMSCVKVFLFMTSLCCVVMATPLDDYVKAPDPHYNYTLLKQLHRENYTVHILNMTSQKWMDDKFSNHPIWWHYVCIVIPKKIKVNDTALLQIDTGKNTDGIPDELDIWLNLVITLSVSTQSVGVSIKQVPNQPIEFPDDERLLSRTEDSLIAWTWRFFLKNPNQPQALAHLPMTKSVVRAMDTAEDYIQKTSKLKVNKFMVWGASKRGWTTWLTAAVDKRVIGMVPIVFDLLNMDKALHHHYRSLGGWSFAFEPYFEANVTHKLSSPNFYKSIDIIDPLVYKDRYKIPTFIVKATGDEFFMLDETMFFYDQLKGPRYLRVVQNCEHTMIGQITNVVLSVRSFYLHFIHGASYPKISWKMTSSKTSGKIRLTVDRKPLSVTVYQAITLPDGRRDFRLLKRDPKSGGKMLHPVLWFKGDVTKLSPIEYEATVNRPQKGWKGFFIAVTFKGVDDSVLAFSTEVNVVPDTLPFPDCQYSNCTGTLV